MSYDDFMRLPPHVRREFKEALAAFSETLDRFAVEMERRERLVSEFRDELDRLPTADDADDDAEEANEPEEADGPERQ